MGVIPGGVTSAGVPSTRQLLVGKNKENLFLYQGALGTLTENAIPTPVGAIDANSAVYIPTKEGLGAVMFLGSDAQMYLTNGNSAIVASDNIKNLVYKLTQDALKLNPTQKFFATYNAQWQYYLIDFGNGTQLCYKWDTNAWWTFAGWPSGPYMTATGVLGLPQLYVAGAEAGSLGLFAIALASTNDNGNNIEAYYTSPYLHGGSPEREKIFDRLTMFTLNLGVQYVVTGTTYPRADNTQQTSWGALMPDPAYGTSQAVLNGLIWNQGNWNQNNWGGAGTGTLNQPYAMAAITTRFFVLSTATQWMPGNTPGPLRSSAIQVKIAWNGGVPDFRLAAFNVAMLFRSIGFVGNRSGATEGQQP
jgi:hypothetical protein